MNLDLDTLDRAPAEEVLRAAHAATADLRRIMRQLDSVAQDAAGITRNVEGATNKLPSLLTQTQQAVYELDRLIVQLQGLWILGGAERAPADSGRLAPTEVQP